MRIRSVVTASLSIAALAGIALLWATHKPAPLRGLKYEVIGGEDLYVRAESDRRYSIWTDQNGMAQDLVRSFAIKDPTSFTLADGQVLVAFLNDRIQDELIQISYQRAASNIFADYVDSGVRWMLGNPGDGKKYSKLTIVVFTPPTKVGHFGLRRMVEGGLSEKTEK